MIPFLLQARVDAIDRNEDGNIDFDVSVVTIQSHYFDENRKNSSPVVRFLFGECFQEFLGKEDRAHDSRYRISQRAKFDELDKDGDELLRGEEAESWLVPDINGMPANKRVSHVLTYKSLL